MEVKLRPWRIEDAPDLQRCADDPAVARNLRDVFPHPYTLQDAQDFLSLCLACSPAQQRCYAIVAEGSLVGSISLARGADVYRKSAELGYWLAREHWGCGLMTEAVRQICREGFAEMDIVRIYAEPYAGNLGSRRVLEKNGFTLEGVLRQGAYKNGQFLDYCVYGLLKDE